MLEIRPIMNSAVQKVFEFKTCCGLKVTDQNLEIQMVNRGGRPVTLRSSLEMKGVFGTRTVPNLMPHGNLKIEPGGIAAFYCMMDEALWEETATISLCDTEGNIHSVMVVHHGAVESEVADGG